MTGMFEMVCYVIHDAAAKESGQDEYCSHEMARAAARAALKIMREPSDAMRNAFYRDNYGDPDAGWKVMIDEILKEESVG